MKTLKEYQQELINNKSNPTALANLSVEAGADFSYYAEQAGELEILRDEFIEKKQKENPKLSNAKCESEWGTTEMGKKDIRVKWKLKGLDKIMAGIKNATIINSVAAKNQF